MLATTATAFKVLPIAAQHPAQLYLASSLVLLGLGALAVSYGAIATLVRDRGSMLATVAALLGGLGAFCGAIVNVVVYPSLAAAATAHVSRGAAAKLLVTASNSEFGHVFLYVYFVSEFLAPLLMGIALWRSRTVPRWLAVLFFVGLRSRRAMGSFGPIVVLFMLPFAAAMVLLAARIWQAAAVPDRRSRTLEPAQPLIRRPENTPGRAAGALAQQLNCEDTGVAFWKPAENPGTRPLRSWAFDIGCAIVAGAASLARFSFGQTAHSGHLSLAAGLIVAVLTAGALPLRRVWPGPVFLWTLLAAAVLAQWPAHGALFPVALAISLYTVAATMRRAEALAAAVLTAGVVLLVVAQDGTRHWALAISDAVGFAAAVLLVGLYVGTRRAYLAELRDRARRLEREREPDQRAGRGGGTGPYRPRDARQRGPPPHRHRGAF